MRLRHISERQHSSSEDGSGLVRTFQVVGLFLAVTFFMVGLSIRTNGQLGTPLAEATYSGSPTPSPSSSPPPSNSPTPTPCAVPSAPQGLTYEPSAPSTIIWQWIQTSDDETGFHIYDAENAYAPLDSVGANVLTYEETGITENQSVSRYVTAYNDCGESDPTNTLAVTFHAPGSAYIMGVTKSPEISHHADNEDRINAYVHYTITNPEFFAIFENYRAINIQSKVDGTLTGHKFTLMVPVTASGTYTGEYHAEWDTLVNSANQHSNDAYNIQYVITGNYTGFPTDSATVATTSEELVGHATTGILGQDKYPGCGDRADNDSNSKTDYSPTHETGYDDTNCTTFADDPEGNVSAWTGTVAVSTSSAPQIRHIDTDADNIDMYVNWSKPAGKRAMFVVYADGTPFTAAYTDITENANTSGTKYIYGGMNISGQGVSHVTSSHQPDIKVEMYDYTAGVTGPFIADTDIGSLPHSRSTGYGHECNDRLDNNSNSAKDYGVDGGCGSYVDEDEATAGVQDKTGTLTISGITSPKITHDPQGQDKVRVDYTITKPTSTYVEVVLLVDGVEEAHRAFIGSSSQSTYIDTLWMAGTGSNRSIELELYDYTTLTREYIDDYVSFDLPTTSTECDDDRDNDLDFAFDWNVSGSAGMDPQCTSYLDDDEST